MCRHLERLQQFGPNYEYSPVSSKSILVVAPHNVEQDKLEFAGLHVQEDTGSRYLGSFIGEATEKGAGKVDDRVHSIKRLLV